MPTDNFHLNRIASAVEQIRDHLLHPRFTITSSSGGTARVIPTPSPDADPLPAADEAAGQPAAPTPSLPGAAGDRPWHDDPQEIARLWSWMEDQGRVPTSYPDHFMRYAHEWSEERERMVREQGRVTTDG